MAFVAPVFADGEIVAFSGSIAHKADVGGAVPGSTSANATEMYHEGLLLPPIKIWDGGSALPDIERIILTNSRQPALMRGDIHAQIAVTQMGAARVKELCERFGARHGDRRLRRDPQGRRRRAARGHRQAAGGRSRPPKGCSTATASWSTSRSSSPSPSRSRTASRASISPNSDPQARGPVNLRPSMVEACVFYSLIGSLGPEPALQRRHARRGAAHVRAAHRGQCRAAGARLQLSDGQPASWST